MALIACSRMYNAAPGVKAAWDRLFAFVGERSGIALEIIDHEAPAPLEALWRRPDLGCAFMCGWPFAMAERQPRIVCAPVPQPPRYGGKPVDVTDFVVRADSGFETLEDTRRPVASFPFGLQRPADLQDTRTAAALRYRGAGRGQSSTVRAMSRCAAGPARRHRGGVSGAFISSEGPSRCRTRRGALRRARAAIEAGPEPS